MSELDLIAPPKPVKVSFSLAQAYSALTSLLLLNLDFSGLDEWVERTAKTLSPGQLQDNQMACGPVCAYLSNKAWPSFLAWVDHLAEQDPVTMRDRELDYLLENAAHILDHSPAGVQTGEKLLSDQAAYLDLVEHIAAHKDAPFDRAHARATHAQLQDPAARQEHIVAHLRTLWDKYLADEWERHVPLLQESIAALESVDYTGKSAGEILTLVTGRELTPKLRIVAETVEELIFIPSPHIGPYLFIIDHGEKYARIVFGARVPQGATVRSPALTRSELTRRLSALADDTRLRILQLVAQKGELRTQEIMTELDLSQSAASRHLPQLSATGFLSERRCEGAKCYRLNADRIDDTFSALQRFLQ